MSGKYTNITFRAPIAQYGIEGAYAFQKITPDKYGNASPCENSEESAGGVICKYTMTPNNGKVYDPLKKEGYSVTGNATGAWH